MMDRKTLNDYYPYWASGDGVFADLTGTPWDELNISTALTLEYHGNISGQKYISPLVAGINASASTTNREKIAQVIMTINGDRWSKLYQTMLLEYNPIENYRMTEQLTNDIKTVGYGKTETRTDNLNHTLTGNDTETPNLTITKTDNLTQNQVNNVVGFNSTAETETGRTNTTNTGTQAETTTGTNTKAHNQTMADTGTQGYNTGGQDTETHNYTLTRSGNIGVTTSQQMIESERNLWLWSFFRDIVFPDLDKILTLAIY